MLWKDSSIFYGVVVCGVGDARTVVVHELHDNPYAAFENIKRDQTGFTFIVNERGVHAYPHKALAYFNRRAKERPKNAQRTHRSQQESNQL